MVSLLNREGVHCVLLFLMISAAYIPTFSGEFILDDRPFVKDNPYLREFHDLSSTLSQEDGVLEGGAASHHSGYYRPLINVTYALDYRVWGLWAPGFRLTNLVLHLLSCLVLYRCLRLATGQGVAALIAVLLFGLHPANTESVSWVTSRNNILVTLFCLGSLYFYIRRQRDHRWIDGVLSLLCFAMALLSKEFAVMLLPILVAWDFFLGKERKPSQSRLWGYLAFLSLVVAYLALRSTVLDQIVPPRDSAGTMWKSLYFLPFLIVFNLRIILFPVQLHNFMVPYPDGLLGWEALAGFGGLLLLGAFAWKVRGNRVLLFSLSSFLIALFPVLHVVPSSATSLVAMRWLYFPMACLSFAAASGAGALLGAKKDRAASRGTIGAVIAGLLLLALGATTYLLNDTLWRSEGNLFRLEVDLFGNTFYAGDLARRHQIRGDFSSAERYYRMALGGRSPDRGGLWINYGGLLVQQGRPGEALPYLERAAGLDLTRKRRAILLNNWGAAYFKLGDYERAIERFRKAVLLRPDDLSYVMNLGNAYLDSGRPERALAVFREALLLAPDSALVRRRIAAASIRMGEVAGAVEALDEIPAEKRSRDTGIRAHLEEARRTKQSPGD
ncbi:MAG: tetratricopeptide repeat protein [Deltaproteobacteria bacterium]|nr:tetratricopeptide repeat protein [Deltaproteobacteria bacterium]